MRRTVFAAAFLASALFAGCASLSPDRIPGDGAGRPSPADRLAGRRFAPPVAGVVSSGFGGRSGRLHAGVDIPASPGTEVRAVDIGVTLYAGNELRGYGNAVILEHGGGVTTLYGHLGTIRVKSGDAVPAGGVVGTVGRTGNATTDHLHFELRLDGQAVDPAPYLHD